MIAASAPWIPRDWLYAGLLLVALLIAYYPALHGTPLWDDDAHLTKPELYSWNGLWRIWFDLGATQQYYPLTHSLFWLQHRLWGDNYTGYHLVNVLLHASAAILLVRILRELRIPGAWLAGALWVLHPMQVESIAWMSELKNTLSTVCYFSAAWCYLRYERERAWKPWALALVLFFLGLMAKSVIATLPAALLLITWWREGRVQWKKDIQPLLPFFAVGIASGLFTAWVERTLIGANGGNFHFSVWERILIAGHAFWFYLFKLLWPAKLTFIYPRWDIDAAQWIQWLYPVLALALVVPLVWKRKQWGRGPLVAVLYFTGTLFPALGFLNIYPFLFSFVADHFQYLACAGPIMLAAAGIASLPRLFNKRNPIIGWIPAGLLLAVCFALTWNQSATYRDSETLWRATLADNKESWMVYHCLGRVLYQQERNDEALVRYRQALQGNPSDYEAYTDMGIILYQTGHIEEAIQSCNEALLVNPSDAETHNTLGMALAQLGKNTEAITQFREALRMKPAYADAHNNLGVLLFQQGQMDEAIFHFREAMRIDPNHADAHSDLASALLQQGRVEDAIEQCREALRIKPDYADAHSNLGNAFLQQGRIDDAITEYHAALRINPSHMNAHYNLARALLKQSRTAEALAEMERALDLSPGNLAIENNLAWLLATANPESLRDGTRAVELAAKADAAYRSKNPAVLETLAAAYAQTGDFAKAMQTAHAALSLAEAQSNTALVASLHHEIQLYEARKKYSQ